MSQLRFKNNHVSVPMSHSCGTWRLHAEVYVGYLFVIMMLLGPACGWDFFNSLLSQKSRTPPLQCIAWLTMICTLEKCKMLSSLQLTGGWNVYLPQNGDDHRKPLIFGKDGYGKPLICRSCSCGVHHELVPFPFCQKLLIHTPCFSRCLFADNWLQLRLPHLSNCLVLFLGSLWSHHCYGPWGLRIRKLWFFTGQMWYLQQKTIPNLVETGEH